MSRLRTGGFVVAALMLIALGAGIGMLVGRTMAASDAKQYRADAYHVEQQVVDARARRDMLNARVELVDDATKSLKPVATKGPLLASAASTVAVKLGSTFSVDGGTYTVHSLRVVDSFESADPKRPGAARDGKRWVLIDTTFVNASKRVQAPACGTMHTVRLVLEDGTTVDEYADSPPVAKGTSNPCGSNLKPGVAGRWIVPILMPEESVAAGIHVADVYDRQTGVPYRNRAGKAAWLQLDQPLKIGKQGDDEITLSFDKDPS